MKKVAKYSLFFLLLLLLSTGLYVIFSNTAQNQAERLAKEARTAAINSVINARVSHTATTSSDPFGEDNHVSILLIGLDTRIGSNESHCDAIQLIEIDKNSETIQITAVPRGTYASLPPGTANTSSDYYVSNSCALGGLEYGIEQIERILGKKADYVVFVGFSETIGILRTLQLPTTDTIKWLRHRQGYQIGEPQRARNHSTFIKQMLVRFTPEEISKTDTALHYILYRFINTDLSFDEAKQIIQTVSDMNITTQPEKISLVMRPAYHVQDIPYDEHTAGAYVEQMIKPIAHYLQDDDYQELTEEDITKKVLSTIEENKHNPEFLTWAVENNLWFQIYDEETRLSVQYDLIMKYLPLLESKQKQEEFLADYVLEMEYLGYTEWAEKGREHIASELAL